MEAKLKGVPETLLIPLWARAAESEMPEPIVKDTKAAEILAQIDYDFCKFKGAKMSQLGVSVRTMLLDRETRRFIDNHPNACVINLGAGLDTRYERLDVKNILWYEVDVAEAIELGRRFFHENERYKYISKSMFDYTWFDEIEDMGKDVLIIAEGLLVYFTEDELIPLFGKLAERFPGAELLLEVHGPALVGRSKRHDSVSKIDGAPEFKWGITNARDMARWHSSIQYLEEWCFFDYHNNRGGLAAKIARLPFVRPKIAPRIVHLRFSSVND